MPKRQTKYIFVTGGVLSGLGKGITAASIGKLLKARKLKVNLQKLDPYLNTDAGTLNPAEHGECFVTKDGAETDLDLGHYERFLDQELTQASSVMSGRIMQKVIQDERAGKYKGKTVQFVPHITGAFQNAVLSAGAGFDVHIAEVGGTVGDYESLSIIEAIRELSLKVGRENCVFVHVVYMPYLGASGEIKTKPAQNAVRDLRGFGIVPDVLVARSENPAPSSVVRKLSLFSGVSENAIALLPNAKTIYEVPLTLEDTGIATVIAKKLQLKIARKPDLKTWRSVVKRASTEFNRSVSVAVVAKYMDNQDTYMSVFEAIRAAAWWNNTKVDIVWVNAEKLEAEDSSTLTKLQNADGILVPGGFGSRGVEGKIYAAKYALTSQRPYLGLCLGMQVAVIAAARQSGLQTAHSSEFNPKARIKVITTMNGQKGLENTGGTMRLGNYDCVLEKKSKTAKLYATTKIQERHRHRYECNAKYVEKFSKWGISPVGVNPSTGLVEVIEAINHPFFVASQFHPEFTSRPNKPHPLFDGFIKSLLQKSKN